MIPLLRTSPVVALALATPAFACSGPGAQRAMEYSELVGWIVAGTTLGFAAWMTLVLPPSRVRIFAWALAIIHPGWWLSARIGDCGMMRMFAVFLFIIPLVFIAIFAIVTYLQLHRPVTPPIATVGGNTSAAARADLRD